MKCTAKELPSGRFVPGSVAGGVVGAVVGVVVGVVGAVVGAGVGAVLGTVEGDVICWEEEEPVGSDKSGVCAGVNTQPASREMINSQLVSKANNFLFIYVPLSVLDKGIIAESLKKVKRTKPHTKCAAYFFFLRYLRR